MHDVASDKISEKWHQCGRRARVHSTLVSDNSIH
ncbi:MAG: hypothetical protein CM15mV12_2330 [uncultured marine virus]|nr:MAG: hypothetical protein CM15mV12_2330 [uncultured marine virus]